MPTRAELLNLAERGGWTFVQALGGYVLAAHSIVDWRAMLAAAGWAAGLSVLKQLGISASLPAVPPIDPNATAQLPIIGKHAQ